MASGTDIKGAMDVRAFNWGPDPRFTGWAHGSLDEFEIRDDR
jgi:hypothetical protein